MLKLVVVVPGVAGEVAPLHGPHHQEDAALQQPGQADHQPGQKLH